MKRIAKAISNCLECPHFVKGNHISVQRPSISLNFAYCGKKLLEGKRAIDLDLFSDLKDVIIPYRGNPEDGAIPQWCPLEDFE